MNSGLLQRVYDDLGNDEPRLVYADWLEEQGDLHADLIRVQCQIASRMPYDADYHRLLDEERPLLRTVRKQLLAPVREVRRPSKYDDGFELPLPHSIDRKWLKHFLAMDETAHISVSVDEPALESELIEEGCQRVRPRRLRMNI